MLATAVTWLGKVTCMYRMQQKSCILYIHVTFPNQVTAVANMQKIGEDGMRNSGDMLAGRQTQADRHGHRNAPLPY